MIISFRTDGPKQTVETQIRLLLEEHLHCLQSASSTVRSVRSNFVIFKSNFDVQDFRTVTRLVSQERLQDMDIIEHF